ncbi:SPFH domain-containing protein [Weissella cibaria]|jgi:Putative virion core protein (lumpy skin disease virus)|uniref:SPFH domain-containing protein n=1 Tax=Weissella cibaria TaxID=137591 RepID=UPI000E500980|nr:SPFH domain-containing protein [Weissella cibaria]RGO78368.1 SPFH domain-containing protein [Weissella cibaria]RHE72795.1 SPFH domain-containing protein [Weissella cibaria]RHE78912.1 SPFH domain-containing protein [Weissella cibaria]
MGLIKAFSGAIGGTFADQWKEIVSAGHFDEHTVVTPGMLQQTNNGRGTNTNGSNGVISNGSKIFVPENTAAFIFSQSGIDEIITDPGGYEFQSGQASIFNGDGVGAALFSQMKERVGFGGQAANQTQIAFVNLREIRNLKFGTRGPVVYNDLFYGTDLEVRAFGAFSVKVVDPIRFIRNFVPANTTYYSFDSDSARGQLTSEFLQSFTSALNGLSAEFRISQLPAHTSEIAKSIIADSYNAGTWPERFGIELVRVGVENIEFSPESRELVKKFSENKMSTKAYDDVSQKTANIAAQQKIAEGIQTHGLGDGGGMLFGMNFAQGMGSNAQQGSTMSIEQQISAVKQLKELLDAGILTQEEFNIKKSEIMGL